MPESTPNLNRCFSVTVFAGSQSACHPESKLYRLACGSQKTVPEKTLSIPQPTLIYLFCKLKIKCKVKYV